MKIKPYRICDICGNEYNKTHMSMKVKIIRNSMAYYCCYNFEKMDICPKCSVEMISWIREKMTENEERCEQVHKRRASDELER